MRALFRRDRLTGQVAVGLVGLLGVSALVYGVGTAGAQYDLGDVGAWLTASDKNTVVHANGPAGKVDGKTDLPPGMRRHRIKVVQDGNNVLLVDEDTGTVSRIDPSQLKVDRSARFGGAGLQIAIRSGAAYAVDPVKGTVQRIDPVTLAAHGTPAQLPPPLGQAGIDASATLWVPAPRSGQLVPFKGGVKGTPVAVGKAGDRLDLTIAAGTPVAINSSDATASIIRNGTVQRVTLPSTAKDGGVKLPAVSDGPTVPMLGKDGALFLLNTQVGQVSPIALKLPAHRFEPPHALGPRIYLPDVTDGRLLVFNTSTGDWENPVKVTRPGGAIEVIVRDGFLWANDPKGADAVAIERNGLTKQIRKYDDRVPGGRRNPVPAPGPGGRGQGGQNGGPGTPEAPPPDGTPTAPRNIRVDPANGELRVTFRPSAGGRPSGYVLKGDTAGLKVRPARVSASGPYQFVVTGADCSGTYSFSVAVQYRDANGRQLEKTSLASAAVRACTPPATPTGFKATARNGNSAVLTWNVVSGVTYTLRVNGGAATTVRSPHTVPDLARGRTHRFTLTAKNEAGTSNGQATARVTLANQTGRFQNQNNGDEGTIIRMDPEGPGQAGEIPAGETITFTVTCQARGDTMEAGGLSSDIWNKVNTTYGNGYLNNVFVTTTKGEFPSDGLPEC